MTFHNKIGNIAKELTLGTAGKALRVIRNRHGGKKADNKRLLRLRQRSRKNRLQSGAYNRNSEKDAYTK